MPHLWDIDAIIQPHRFVLVVMCMLDTLLQCILWMAILSPFWVVQVVTNLSLDLGNCNQIQIQYWMPNSFQHVHADTYVGWDLKKGNMQCEDKGFLPSWSQTDCIMSAWKSKICYRIADPKMRILAKQIAIINTSLEAYKSPSGSE